MSKAMRNALALMARARADDPTTDDGVLASCATFYDSEIAVAYVNHRTASALVRRGLIRYGEWYGPDEGQALILVAQPAEEQ